MHQAIAAIGASHPTVAQLQRQQVEHRRSTIERSSPTLQESAEVLSQLAHPINVRSFASEQLCMLPILHRFLIDVVQPLEIMADEIRCFSLLVRIVSLLSLGPEQSVQHTAAIEKSIVDHHTLYSRVYPGQIRPKWHHLLHIPDNMRHAGRLLSCFVTERKHRVVKSACLNVFRHFEATVTADIVNRQVESFQDDDCRLFSRMHLIRPSAVTMGNCTLHSSSAALLPCGEVHRGDIVAARQQMLGKVVQFWSDIDGAIVVSIIVYRRDADCPSSFHVGEGYAVIDAEDVIQSVMWCERSMGLIRAVLPIHW